MPFGFRKSFGLKGFKVNISKSGVGFSTGVKGFRVSTGPRGSYVNIGTGGVYYRAKIGPRASRPTIGQATGQADAGEMGPPSPMPPIVADLNEINGRFSIAWLPAVLGVALSFVFSFVHPLAGAAMLALGFGAMWAIGSAEIRSSRYEVHYSLDADSLLRFRDLAQSVSAASSSQRKWRVTSRSAAWDFKRQAGASEIVGRTPASIKLAPPRFVTANVDVWAVSSLGEDLFFLPDMLLARRAGTYASVPYGSVSVATGSYSFIEREAPPTDAARVGSTWQHPNKDGSPDRRFSYNPSLPVMGYTVVELTSQTGMYVLLMFSSAQAANTFVQGLRRYLSGGGATSSASQGPTPPPKQGPRTSPPSASASKVPDCFKLLGVTATCTRDELKAAYHSKAKLYHPDLVAGLGPEIQEMAREKMTAVNDAYVEAKRLRGF